MCIFDQKIGFDSLTITQEAVVNLCKRGFIGKHVSTQIGLNIKRNPTNKGHYTLVADATDKGDYNIMIGGSETRIDQATYDLSILVVPAKSPG